MVAASRIRVWVSEVRVGDCLLDGVWYRVVRIVRCGGRLGLVVQAVASGESVSWWEWPDRVVLVERGGCWC